mgnify:CR=1 FL=1
MRRPAAFASDTRVLSPVDARQRISEENRGQMPTTVTTVAHRGRPGPCDRVHQRGIDVSHGRPPDAGDNHLTGRRPGPRHPNVSTSLTMSANRNDRESHPGHAAITTGCAGAGGQVG